jgi:hypothetical protein
MLAMIERVERVLEGVGERERAVLGISEGEEGMEIEGQNIGLGLGYSDPILNTIHKYF